MWKIFRKYFRGKYVGKKLGIDGGGYFVCSYQFNTVGKIQFAQGVIVVDGNAYYL